MEQSSLDLISRKRSKSDWCTIERRLINDLPAAVAATARTGMRNLVIAIASFFRSVVR